jgi:hypothetical protein
MALLRGYAKMSKLPWRGACASPGERGFSLSKLTVRSTCPTTCPAEALAKEEALAKSGDRTNAAHWSAKRHFLAQAREPQASVGGNRSSDIRPIGTIQ